MSTTEEPERPLSPSFGPAHIYDGRNDDDGAYMQLKQSLCDPAMQSSFLGSSSESLGATYRIESQRAETTTGWNSYHVVRNTPAKEPYKTIIVAEMRGTREGTKVGAVGNFYTGPNAKEKHMTDGTTCRNILMGGPPTAAPPSIKAMWNNQLAELDALANEISARTGRGNNMTSIVHNSPKGEQLLRIVTDTIYEKLKDQKEHQPPSKIVLNKDTLESIDDNGPELAPVQTKISTQNTDPEIKLGAHYDLGKLPDHKGDLFRQYHSVVKQHDIVDIYGNLVPPWKLYDALRKGVLALFEGVFNIWCPPSRPVCLQFEAQSIRVIAEAEGILEEPKIHGEVKRTPTHAATAEKRSASFEAFGHRLKRLRKDLLPDNSDKRPTEPPPSQSASADKSPIWDIEDEDVPMADHSNQKGKAPASTGRITTRSMNEK
ncbi:hypothetical protein BJ165DRAFT_1533910 [Panaeolus papilionaceus]|nr:hypothetical protein BJ165DRAFT_1533910 [Panaeolus papilionaceus]